MFSALKKKLGKKKKGQTRGVPLPQDHLQANTPFGDGDVRKIKHLGTASANGGIDKVKYNREIGSSGTNKGFFKGDGGFEDPMLAVSNRNKESDNNHMGIRAVMSSRIDKKLRTNALTDEVFATHGGTEGTVSSMAKGEALRTNDADFHMAFSKVDGRDAAYQQSMWNLQLNDYLSGQVDRHGGNIFFDDETGRVRGIDNDLAFGDRYNETMGQAKTGMGDNSKHIREMPHMIDRQTADAVMAIDELEYFEMLQGQSGDREHLDFEEVTQAYERLLALKEHIEGIETGENGGQIVDEWNADTYQEAMNHGEDEKSSYLRYNQEAAEYFEDKGDNRDLSQQTGIKTFKGDQKRAKKRNKQERKAAKAMKKATKRQRKAERAANKLDLSASNAVTGGLFDYLDPSI